MLSNNINGGAIVDHLGPRFEIDFSSEWAWGGVRGQSEDSIEAICLLSFSL